MSDLSQKPISSLAKEYMEKDMYHHAADEHCDDNGYGWWFFLFWFLIIGIIVWFLLFALKPDFVQKKDCDGYPTGEVDQGRVLGTAIVVALIIILVVWILQWGFGDRY